MNSVSDQKWWHFPVVSDKVTICTTFLKQVWKGFILRLFTGEKALKELTPQRVRQLSSIEIRCLSVKQLEVIQVKRFSEEQIKSLPSDFFLKFKKIEQVESFVTSLSALQIEAYFSKVEKNEDAKKLSQLVTPLQLKGVGALCAAKIVYYLDEKKKKEFWAQKDLDLKAILYGKTKEESERARYLEDIFSLSPSDLSTFLLKLEKSDLLVLLRQMRPKELSSLLEHVYSQKEDSLKKAIGIPFFEDEECLNKQLPQLELNVLNILIEEIKGHLDTKKVTISHTKEFPDSVKLSLLDNLLGKKEADLKSCIEIYSTELFRSYLEGTYDEMKRLKCLGALVESPHATLLKGRWRSFNNPLSALNHLILLTPDEIRSYWDSYKQEKVIVYQGGNRNVIRSYFYIETGAIRRLQTVTNLEEQVFLQLLPMIGKELLQDATLLKNKINQADLENYVKALCQEPNSEKCAQLGVIALKKYPGIVPIALQESLTQKEQDVLLKILLSAKRPAQEILSALKIACQITNTSYEERMSVCIPDDERLGDFVGVLLKEGFIGFPRIAQKLIGLNNDLSSNVEEVLKTDLNLLQTSLASTVENPTNQKIIDLEALCLKVISFKVVLLEVNKYSKMEFSVIERVQEFLKDKVENARASLNKEAGECESTSYLNSSDQILRNYPQVKDLSRLILRNGTPVYCKGSGKPATLLRFRRYLKENPSV